MEKNLKMFKAYDIRTKIGALDNQIISALADQVARYYKEDVKVDSVIIARDARLHCPKLMEALIESITKAGMDLYLNPLQTSTCQFYFMCMQKKDSGGIMITASHNPGEYVGLKLVSKDVAPIASGCGPEGGIDKIKQYYISDTPTLISEKRGKIHELQMIKEYVDYSMRLAGVEEGSLKGLKVFGEFLSGAAGADFLMAFDKAGADLTLSNLVPDGFFPSGDPNPIIETSIAPSREKMRKGNFDIGFCFDGDGDRMDLMFPDGTQVIPGLNMSILIPYIKDIFKGTRKNSDFKIFVDVKAIPLALIEIAKRDIEPHIIRNGHSFIKQKLRENYKEGYIVSEEESAHYYMNFPFDPTDFSKGTAAVENTLFFALLSAKAMKEHPEEYKRVYEIQKNINRFREWPLNFDDPSKMEQIMKDVEKAMTDKGALVIKDMDDGSDLDATLMRFNLPVRFTSSSLFPTDWVQVAQRISRSEDAMTRWEVVASSKELCKEFNDIVEKIASSYVEKGWAHF